jgi:hypothetical protein
MVVFISLMLLVISGCAASDISGVYDISKDNVSVIEEPQTPNQPENPDIAADSIETAETDKGIITESGKISGWKELKAKVPLSELTENGSHPIENSEEFEFSLHFPGSWTMSYTVFYDDNNQKVAEIPPPVLLEPGQESEFLNYNPSVVSDEELLTKADFPVSTYNGSRTVTKIATESGSWHPNIYRITDGSYGFSIVLYSETINEEEQALFDRIVSTVSFE